MAGSSEIFDFAVINWYYDDSYRCLIFGLDSFDVIVNVGMVRDVLSDDGMPELDATDVRNEHSNILLDGN